MSYLRVISITLNMLNISLFDRFREWVELLPEEDRDKIDDILVTLRKQNFEMLYMKEISGPIREIRMGKYRILFCIKYSTIYVFTGFVKKTLRTPRDHKKIAQKLYALLLQEINNMKIIGGHKLYTYEECLKDWMKSPTFRAAHEKSELKHSMIREMRLARQAKNMSQETLAKKTGMSQSVIARLESGRHSFTLTTLFRIAKVLGKEVRLV